MGHSRLCPLRIFLPSTCSHLVWISGTVRVISSVHWYFQVFSFWKCKIPLLCPHSVDVVLWIDLIKHIWIETAHVTSGIKYLRASAQFFMLMSSDNDDPDDRGFKSVWILEGDWHGTNHSNDPRFYVAWRRHTFSLQCHWVWEVVTIVLIYKSTPENNYTIKKWKTNCKIYVTGLRVKWKVEKNLLSDTEKSTVPGKIFVNLSSVVKWKADYAPKELFALGKSKILLVVCVSCCLARRVKKKKKMSSEINV